MRVEANLVSKNTTIDVHEWHDGLRNRGAAHTWYSSVPISYIYSYDTDEMFTFEQMAGTGQVVMDSDRGFVFLSLFSIMPVL